MAAIAGLLLAGCQGGHRDLPLNETLARDSLAGALEAWKQGRRPDDLKQADPPIIMGDPAWEGGKSLVSYTIMEGAKSDGSNMHISVRRTLKGAGPRMTSGDVVYVVGTHPAITIFPE